MILRPQVLLSVYFEHPVILVVKKLTGSVFNEIIKDCQLLRFHVFFHQGKPYVKMGKSYPGQKLGQFFSVSRCINKSFQSSIFYESVGVVWAVEVIAIRSSPHRKCARVRREILIDKF